MKKFFVSLVTAMTAVSAFSEVPAGLITSQPEGTLYTDVYSSSREFLMYGGMPARTDNWGYRSEIVVNGNDIYIHNVIRDYEGLDSWIKGTITDGVAEFPLPQPVYYKAGDEAEGTAEVVLYAEMVKAVGTASDKTIVPDAEAPSLRMTWDGKNLVQILPPPSADDPDYDGLCALTNSKHGYMAYGSKDIRYQIWEEKPLSAPATLETRLYSLTYTDQMDESQTRQVSVGVDGSDLWIQGLNSFLPETWVKGSIGADGKVTLPSGQYMGLKNDYYMFFMGAEYEKSGYRIIDAATISTEGDNYVAETSMLINLGKDGSSPAGNLNMRSAVFAPVTSAIQTPDNPEILEISYEEGLSMLVFIIMPSDIQGEALNSSNLYFNVFVNGEPYTFTPENSFVPESITDIPFTYPYYDSYLMAGGDGMFIAGVEGVLEKMGVQSFYVNHDGTVTKSALVEEAFQSAGIEDASVVESPVVKSEYFDFCGVRVADPAPGLYIRRDTRADGTVNATKVIVR